jgi:hypothetical protein
MRMLVLRQLTPRRSEVLGTQLALLLLEAVRAARAWPRTDLARAVRAGGGQGRASLRHLGPMSPPQTLGPKPGSWMSVRKEAHPWSSQPSSRCSICKTPFGEAVTCCVHLPCPPAAMAGGARHATTLPAAPHTLTRPRTPHQHPPTARTGAPPSGPPAGAALQQCRARTGEVRVPLVDKTRQGTRHERGYGSFSFFLIRCPSEPSWCPTRFFAVNVVIT